MTTASDQISPELALVDAELDEAGRRRMQLAHRRETVTPRPRRKRSRPSPILIAALVTVLALLVAPGSLMGDSHPGQTQPLERTTAGERVSLRWARVPGATYYNVILWRNGARVLDFWPHRATVRVPRAKLQPGTYLWFVYPGFGSERARRFGELAKRGKFSL